MRLAVLALRREKGLPITRITRAARWAAAALAGLGVRKLAEAMMVVLTVVLGQPMLGAHG